MNNTEEQIEVPAKFQKLVDEIEKMSVLDLSELVKILEKKFGVSAAAPAMMMAGPAAEAAPVEEKDSFDIELSDAGSNKIAVIKAIREIIPELGLKEAKDMVDACPADLGTMKKDAANDAKAKLEAAGAQVELK